VRPLVPAAANLYYVHCGFIAILPLWGRRSLPWTKE
jgi:hypothetical protein